MFDQNVSSIGCGMDLLGDAVDFDDLAFMSLVASMQESDGELALKMRDIRAADQRKQVLSDEISSLEGYLSRSGTKPDDPDALVYVEGGLDNPTDPAKSRFKTDQDQQEYQKDVAMFRAGWICQDIAAGQWEGYCTKHGIPDAPGQAGQTPAQDLANASCFKRSEVENKVEELKRDLEDMNSASSVMMIDLQRIMNKRSEAVQLTTNIIARSHETAMGVIANLK